MREGLYVGKQEDGWMDETRCKAFQVTQQKEGLKKARAKADDDFNYQYVDYFLP